MARRLREIICSGWLWRLKPGSNRVVLTFDDGPHIDTTPSLLAELDRLKIPTTHFVIGSHCARCVDLVRQVADSGHVIGNHGFEHRGFAFMSRAGQQTSISAADSEIRRALGIGCTLFRPPFGSLNMWTRPTLQSLGYRGVLWSVIARDWAAQSEGDLWSHLSSQLHDGAIIVLHDGHPTTAGVIRILPRLAEEIARRGWSFTHLTPQDLQLL
jgi:peptidoglycan-N-acetylglucosamine deacetylase